MLKGPNITYETSKRRKNVQYIRQIIKHLVTIKAEEKVLIELIGKNYLIKKYNYEKM